MLSSLLMFIHQCNRREVVCKQNRRASVLAWLAEREHTGEGVCATAIQLHSEARRCHWLSAVLTTMIAPIRMCWISTGTWNELTPFLRTPRIRTPRIVPRTVP